MSREDDAHDARFDGKAAYRAGVALGDCPEPPGTLESWAWQVGWRSERLIQGRILMQTLEKVARGEMTAEEAEALLRRAKCREALGHWTPLGEAAAVALAEAERARLNRQCREALDAPPVLRVVGEEESDR